jgi:hypothetical protein
MRKIVGRAAVSAGMLVLAALSAPGQATAAPAPLAGCTTDSELTDWGSFHANVCWGGATSTGWVRDRKSDGLCAYVVITYFLSNGGETAWTSPRACPNGDVDDFSHQSPGNATWAIANMHRN